MKTLLQGKPYTPSRDMDPEYLKRRFKQIRKEQKEQKEAQQALDRKITRIERKVA